MQKRISMLTVSFILMSMARASIYSMHARPCPREDPGIDAALVKSCCEKVGKDKRRIYYVNTRTFRMGMQLKGIYTRGPLLFFRLKLANHSHIDYDVDSIRFFITETLPPKRAAPSISMVSPLYCYGNSRTIAGKSQEECIMVLPRFTLSAGKMLVIRASEKNGGRRLQLKVDNFTLLRSRLLEL